MTTYIHEYEHRPCNISWHPTSNDFTPNNLTTALSKTINSIELDLRVRTKDGSDEVYVNHDSDDGGDHPTLQATLQTIISDMEDNHYDTVMNDGYQFFIVLDPKEDNDFLYKQTYEKVKDELGQYLSTNFTDAGTTTQRPITVVLTAMDGTGKKMYDYLASQYTTAEINQFLLCEGFSYKDGSDEGEIVSKSSIKSGFLWSQAIKKNSDKSNNAYHQDGYNTRIWDIGGSADSIMNAFYKGCDTVNVNLGIFDGIMVSLLDTVKNRMNSQEPRINGSGGPSLAIRQDANDNYIAALAFGGNDNRIYMARGTFNDTSLSFKRQILLTDFLSDSPQCDGTPSIDIAGTDLSKLYLGYKGRGSHNLWGTGGTLSDNTTFMILDGEQQRLIDAGSGKVLGEAPTVRFYGDVTIKNPKVVVIYRGTNGHKIWYVIGTMNNNGTISGTEYQLKAGNVEPKASNRVQIAFLGTTDDFIIFYEGTNNQNLFYCIGSVIGTTNPKLECTEYRLTDGDKRKGKHASVAMNSSGDVLMTYDTSSNLRSKKDDLWYTTATYSSDSALSNIVETSLTNDEGHMKGSWTSCVLFDRDSNNDAKAVIIYKGSDGHKIWYTVSSGQIGKDSTIRFSGDTLLDIGLGY